MMLCLLPEYFDFVTLHHPVFGHEGKGVFLLARRQAHAQR